MDAETVASKIDALYERLSTDLKPGLPDDLQSELAELVNILPDLRKVENAALFGSAEIATAALIGDQPNTKLAKDIRENIERRSACLPELTCRQWLAYPQVTRAAFPN